MIGGAAERQAFGGLISILSWILSHYLAALRVDYWRWMPD